MLTQEQNDALVTKLNSIKPVPDRGDDFIPEEWFGNSQDCYESGCRDGEAYLATELRALLGLPEVPDTD